MATLHGLDDPEVQVQMQKLNAGTWDPRIDRNMTRAPERMIHVFSISPREFVVDRPPLWIKFRLRACPKNERYVAVAHIPDPMMQKVHNTDTGKFRGEAHDGLRCTIDMLNPNNPTNDPDWNPGPEMAAYFSTSRGSDLFAQGLFVSLNEVPSEREIEKAVKRRERYYRALIAQADEVEATDRRELMVMLKGEEGTDLRMALDYFGEQREYHKPMVATVECPNCGEQKKGNAAFHKSQALGVICVMPTADAWQRAVDAGVKNKTDVPDKFRWWTEDAKPATTPKAARTKAPKPKSRKKA